MRWNTALYAGLIILISTMISMPGCIEVKINSNGADSTQQSAPYQGVPDTGSNAEHQNGTVGSSETQSDTVPTGLEEQPEITYGAYALWTGTWETTFFRYGGKMHTAVFELVQDESKVTGTYDWDSGRLNAYQSKTDGLLIGKWSESPTYQPPDDAGDIELQQSPDGNSFTGKWRYGSGGDWIGEWNGRRIR